jgi:hypothetical protein
VSLTRGQAALIDLALDRLDTVKGQHREPVEYILDQLVYGGTAEYHGGVRPERDAKEVSFLIDLLRERMRSLPKLSELSLDTADEQE